MQLHIDFNAAPTRTGVIYIGTVNDMSYIGQTVNCDQRKKQHLQACRSTPFHRAIRLYGTLAVEFRILESDIPEERLSARESLWIDFYDTLHNGYNQQHQLGPKKYYYVKNTDRRDQQRAEKERLQEQARQLYRNGTSVEEIMAELNKNKGFVLTAIRPIRDKRTVACHILELLSDRNCWQLRDITTALNRSSTAVKRGLTMLIKSDKVRKIRFGIYQIVD